MLDNPCNYIFTLISFSYELVNLELMYWKVGQISIVNDSYKSRADGKGKIVPKISSNKSGRELWFFFRSSIARVLKFHALVVDYVYTALMMLKATSNKPILLNGSLIYLIWLKNSHFRVCRFVFYGNFSFAFFFEYIFKNILAMSKKLEDLNYWESHHLAI